MKMLKVGLKSRISGTWGCTWPKLKVGLKSRIGGSWLKLAKVENWWCMVKVESFLEVENWWIMVKNVFKSRIGGTLGGTWPKLKVGLKSRIGGAWSKLKVGLKSRIGYTYLGRYMAKAESWLEVENWWYLGAVHTWPKSKVGVKLRIGGAWLKLKVGLNWLYLGRYMAKVELEVNNLW